ncbi:MAG TPA: hypothetical protein VNS50_13900 [Ginsengibacter sp.]|nr:hypothetical protein [Ginsengibacter sp.]
MEQIILKIKNKKKIPFLKELLKQFDFVEIIDSSSKKKKSKKEEILDGIEESVEFIKKYNRGEVKAKSLKELLDEL